MTADLTAAARAALSERRAKVEASTPAPWRSHRGGIEAGTYDSVLEPGRVECMAYCYGGSSTIVGDRLDEDKALIVQMRSDYEALLSIGLAVIERHHASPSFLIGYGECCDQCSGDDYETPWPCAEVKPWLDLLGVGEGE